MESDSGTLNQKIQPQQPRRSREQPDEEGVCARARALLVALLGASVSACALAATAAPPDDDGDDAETEERMSCVGAARRMTKPLIRLAFGSSKLSVLVTAVSSLLLLVAVMSKAWWRRGARWLAAPALLTASLELCADAADAALTAALLAATEPLAAVLHAAAAMFLLTAEMLIWHSIAKFFEHDSPEHLEDNCVQQLAIAPFRSINSLKCN